MARAHATLAPHDPILPKKPTVLAFSWLDGLALFSFFVITSLLFRRRRLVKGVDTSIVSSTVAMHKNAQAIAEKARRGEGEVKVAKILVHPIKSCRGTSVESALYTPEGLEHDRMWSVIDAQSKSVLTARDLPMMVLITPRIELDANSPFGGNLTVSFPSDSGCATFSVPLRPTDEVLRTWSRLNSISLFLTSGIDGYIAECVPPASASPSQILSAFLKREVHLAYKGPKPRVCAPTVAFPNLQASLVFQDGYPLLLMSAENTTALDEWVMEMEREGRATGRQLIGEEWSQGGIRVERFRPNIVVQGAGPFAEDSWTEIAIGPTKEEAKGALPISLVSKCQRCLLPNVSPETGARDKAVPFKVLMKHRIGVDPLAKMKPCVGVNGVPSGSGVVTVGDWVDVRNCADDD